MVAPVIGRCSVAEVDSSVQANLESAQWSPLKGLRVPDQIVPSLHNSISFGPFRLIPAERVLLEAGKPVRLGSRALDILITLTKHAGELVSKDELVARVWPDTIVEECNLRVNVAALRRALGDGEAGARYVTNIPGRGYRFVAPVSVSRSPARPVSRASGVERMHNLPVPLTRIVGRAEIVGALAARLPQRRLVTIVGPGGIGKTTVALAVAHELNASYKDGVWFVDLAPLTDPMLLPSTVAAVLGLPIRSENPLPALVTFLRDKRMLLVLDGCEQFVETAAAFAVELLRGAPGVHILATSREPLRAEGERVQRLDPLGLPPVSTELTAAEAFTFPAVELFVERAAASVDGFELSNADAPAVAKICCRLDGIALAIELAAGRVASFGLRGVAARLDDRFRLLTHGRRTALPRHRTLSATLDWSYELLSESQRMVLRSLSVFAGGFTFDSARAVVTGPEVAALDIADIVAALVNKSLVTAEIDGAVVQYRLLDTTRAYALGKLDESSERQQVSRRHAEHYLLVFERARAEWEIRPASDWLANYGCHVENVRAALDWAFSPIGDTTIGVALTIASVPLWTHLSWMEECRQRIERALSVLALGAGRDALGASQNARWHMELLTALGPAILLTKGFSPDVTAACTNALAIAESLGDTDYQLRALWGLYVDRFTNGRFRAALALAQRFRRIASQTDDANSLVGERLTGVVLHVLGDQASARQHIEHALSVAPAYHGHIIRYQFDHRVVARSFHARILWLQGFADQALRTAERSILDAQSIDHPVSVYYALVQAACPVALLAGELAAAERFVNRLTELSVRHAFIPWDIWGQCFKGVLLIKLGQFGTGLQLLRAGLAGLPETAFHLHYTPFLAELAEALGRTGAPAEGLATIDEALARSERHEERWSVAELLRMKGELLLLEGAPKAAVAAEEHFLKSLDWAHRQGALSWELRTATSSARLWRNQGRTAEARSVLAPVCSRFSEGFATADMMAARDLLAALA